MRPEVRRSGGAIGSPTSSASAESWLLGDWNFRAAERSTLLAYLLEYYLVRPLLRLAELAMRLVSTTAGIIALPACTSWEPGSWELARDSSRPCA